MAEAAQFTIGADAACSDGSCGRVSRVVVDPVARAVTHLVVEPKHWQGPARLVPLDLVESANGDVLLRCSLAEFEKLEAAEETRFLAGSEGVGGYDNEQALSWPYYGLGVGGFGMGPVGLGAGNLSLPITYETIPLGEVALQRGEPVHASDGDIGRVHGLIVDADNRQVTHILLREGHLWGRKEVAIPISAVTTVDGGIHLKLTKQQVQDLPAVPINQRPGEPPWVSSGGAPGAPMPHPPR